MQGRGGNLARDSGIRGAANDVLIFRLAKCPPLAHSILAAWTWAATLRRKAEPHVDGMREAPGGSFRRVLWYLWDCGKGKSAGVACGSGGEQVRMFTARTSLHSISAVAMPLRGCLDVQLLCH